MTPSRPRPGAGPRLWAALLFLGACPDADEPSRPPAPKQPEVSAVPEVIHFGSGADAPSARLSERADTQKVEVVDPYEERTVQFEGVPARAVLDELLGKDWRRADEVVFECADGYRATVPVSRLLGHEAWFAVSRVGADFAIDKPVGGRVEHTPLAPAYLIWDNLHDPLIRSEGDWGWPYQIVRVEVASPSTVRYARMAPPEPAGGPNGGRAQQGFLAFRRYCSRCHRINGVGGQVGPELNYPASVTEYMKPDWLRRWIDQPLSVRHGTPMPGLPPTAPSRPQTLDDLIAYLNAMAQRKLAPSAAGEREGE